MVITCGKPLRQAHSRNLMLFLLAPYSSNTPLHGLTNRFPFNWLIYCYTSVTILKEEGMNRGCSFIWGKAIVQHSLTVVHLQLYSTSLINPKHITKKFIVSPAGMLKCLQKWSGIYRVKKLSFFHCLTNCSFEKPPNMVRHVGGWIKTPLVSCHFMKGNSMVVVGMVIHCCMCYGHGL
jgi:hypothetical protein